MIFLIIFAAIGAALIAGVIAFFVTMALVDRFATGDEGLGYVVVGGAVAVVVMGITAVTVLMAGVGAF